MSAQIAAVLGRERRDVLRDLLHHRAHRIRGVTSLPPKCSASVTTPSGIDIQALMRGGASGCGRIALDPHQFGRAAADVEQDRAAAPGIEQRRAADHGERRLGLAVDHLEPDAGLGGDPVPKAVGIGGRAAGFGRDQPQPLGLAVAGSCRGRCCSAAMARSIAASLMRAGRRNALAEPDDPRERIDHAKAVAGRAGDQQPAIVGAEVERGIDAGCAAACRRAADPDAALRAAARPSRSRVSSFIKTVFPRPLPADEELPFTETLAAPRRRRNNPSHSDHAQSGVVVG